LSVSDLYCVVGGRRISVDVAVLSLDIGAAWRIVALHVDVLDHGIVVSLLHVRRIPIDQSTGPVNGALAVTWKTRRPKGKHDPRRCLRVIKAVRRAIPGV